MLKNGAETDLLEVSDEVMASLNFLICVFLRDKTNSLGLMDIVPQIDNDYLKPLNAGLSMSRAHYKLKLDENKNPLSHGFVQISCTILRIAYGVSRGFF